MKNNEKSSLLAVPQSEVLVQTGEKFFSDVKIIEHKKADEEIAKEEELKQYADFFQKEISKLEKVKKGQIYNAIEIANEQFLTVTDYLNRDLIQSQDLKINYQINTLDGLMRLLENPMQLKKVNLIHAVMPFEDAVSLVYPLSQIPQVSECRTRVVLGAYGNVNDAEELDFNNRVMNAMFNQLDFCVFRENMKNGVYSKMVYSAYQKNMKMKH